ncbi:MAG: helix-turn-helix domain-containing protein [Limisphaerales bacterium]
MDRWTQGIAGSGQDRGIPAFSAGIWRNIEFLSEFPANSLTTKIISPENRTFLGVDVRTSLLTDFKHSANFMNPPQTPNPDQITIQFNGQISISRQSLKMLQVELRPENLPIFPPLPGKINSPENSENKRLAYTMRETAEIMGVSYITVHRLIKRGLLKNSKVLRNKIIPAAEIERFLKETM